MLALVEGLNGAGKSTYIKGQTGIVLHTPYANPLRWEKSKHRLIGSLDRKECYAIGVYEAIYHTHVDFGNMRRSYWWDRTWISAYVYGSIKKEAFDFLSDLYVEITNHIVFVDTNVSICKERFANSVEDKSYVNNFEWNKLHSRFCRAMQELNTKGYKIKTIKGVADESVPV